MGLTTEYIVICSCLPASLFLLGCKDSGVFNDNSGPQSNWEVVRAGNDTYFHGICFSDPITGWAVGDSGVILHTSDGGNSWNVRPSGISVNLKCITFASPSCGWIGAGTSLIGRTTNGGSSWTWQHLTNDSNRTYMGLSFVDDQIGWAGDNYGEILNTQDGGSTWVPQSSGTRWAITSLQFLDHNEGWACATNRLVLHTTDGGSNWSVATLDSIDYGRRVTVVFEDIFFLNRSHGWIATTTALSDTDFHPTSILRTTDGGATWSLQQTPEDMSVTAITFQNEQMGWASSYRGILFTNDQGTHWTYQVQSPAALIVDICFVDRTCGWALSFTGNIYRYQASGKVTN